MKKIIIIMAFFSTFLFSAPVSALKNADPKSPPPLPIKKILIIARAESRNIEDTPVLIIIDSFKHYFGISAKIETLGVSTVNESPKITAGIQSFLDKFKPDLILLLNNNSPHALNWIKNIPIIHVYGYSPQPLGDNFTEITLYLPPKVQLSQLKKAFPKIKRVGLFHSPKSDFPLKAAKKAARRLDIELIVQRIAPGQDLNEKIEDMLIKHMIHAFWLIPEPALYQDHKIKKSFLYKANSLGIPVLGFLRDHIFDGAFMAVEFNFQDLGKQAGQMAAKILYEGMPVESLRPQAPRKSDTFISITVLKKSFLLHLFDPKFLEEVFILEAHPNFKLWMLPPHLGE